MLVSLRAQYRNMGEAGLNVARIQAQNVGKGLARRDKVAERVLAGAEEEPGLRVGRLAADMRLQYRQSFAGSAGPQVPQRYRVGQTLLLRERRGADDFLLDTEIADAVAQSCALRVRAGEESADLCTAAVA